LQLQLRSIDVELEETRRARDDAERAAAEARRELQERSRVSFPDGLPHEPRALPPTPAGEDPVLVEVLLRRTRAEAEARARAEREEEVRWLTEALSETRAEANALRKEAETLAGNAKLARLTADEDSAQALRRAVALQEETVALRGMVEQQAAAARDEIAAARRQALIARAEADEALMARAEHDSALSKLRFAAESWEDRARNAFARLEEAEADAHHLRARLQEGHARASERDREMAQMMESFKDEGTVALSAAVVEAQMVANARGSEALALRTECDHLRIEVRARSEEISALQQRLQLNERGSALGGHERAADLEAELRVAAAQLAERERERGALLAGRAEAAAEAARLEAELREAAADAGALQAAVEALEEAGRAPAVNPDLVRRLAQLEESAARMQAQAEDAAQRQTEAHRAAVEGWQNRVLELQRAVARGEERMLSEVRAREFQLLKHSRLAAEGARVAAAARHQAAELDSLLAIKRQEASEHGDRAAQLESQVMAMEAHIETLTAALQSASRLQERLHPRASPGGAEWAGAPHIGLAHSPRPSREFQVRHARPSPGDPRPRADLPRGLGQLAGPSQPRALSPCRVTRARVPLRRPRQARRLRLTILPLASVLSCFRPTLTTTFSVQAPSSSRPAARPEPLRAGRGSTGCQAPFEPFERSLLGRAAGAPRGAPRWRCAHAVRRPRQ
jgi:hypothetical protein